jgi:hypothetical protein
MTYDFTDAFDKLQSHLRHNCSEVECVWGEEPAE